jgi:hypothetical protein
MSELRSLSYNSRRGCPEGYHKRAQYKSATNKTVRARCVRATTTYKESRANFEKRMNATQKRRMLSLSRRIPSIKSLSRKTCPPGQIERKGYVRQFSSNIQRKGYTVQKKSGISYTVHPKKRSAFVKPRCVKDTGRPGKGTRSRKGIGHLRKGELKKYGYSSTQNQADRHKALGKAMKEFGPLGVFRKLVAVANYTENTLPAKSRIYRADADWIRDKHGGKLSAPKL